jgi:methionyl aminopeptidase
MRTLVNSGIVEAYAPLVDVPGSFIAQFEHVSYASSQGICPN